MKIAIGCDHAGFPLKDFVAQHIQKLGHELIDCGAFDTQPSDYPDFARAVGQTVLDGKADRGVLICGSGVGASVAANKLPGIRACMCGDTFSSRQGVEDDDMNVLCLGARIIGPEVAAECLRAFLAAKFSGLERHVRRVGKIHQIEVDARAGKFDAPSQATGRK